jgi:hypothetical protein
MRLAAAQEPPTGRTAGAIRAPVDRSCLIRPSETPGNPRKSSQPRSGRLATIASAVVRFTPGSFSISPALAELRSTQRRAGGGSGCRLGGLYLPCRINTPGLILRNRGVLWLCAGEPVSGRVIESGRDGVTGMKL